jgi:hypothetical protein
MAELEGINHIDDKIEYCIDTILKEARQEDRLVKQLVYTMLSAYTNNPINLAVNSPSGEGKDYVITKVGDIFPKQDIMFLAGMSDKALFHRQGVLVIKNENGEYEPIEDRIVEIDSQIEDYESEIAISKDKNFKQGRRSLIKQLEQQKKDLLQDARKLIDLSHKILVFLDTPRPELFNALMPLLSHDRYEVEYEFADSTNTGIRTRNNVLRGWPAVISAQAIEWSRYQRYPEIQRRFIVTNPKMTTEKYAAAIDLAVDRFGLPDIMYQQKIVSDTDKEKTRQIISEIKEHMLFMCDRIKPGKNNVFAPFRQSLKPQLPKQKAFDMTTANRFGAFLDLLPLINIDKRPMITILFEGNPIIHRIPFALFEDLKESMFLMEYADGIRPYLLEWYYAVFLENFDEKDHPDYKTVVNPKTGEETKIEEKIIALTTEDLVKKTKEVYNRVYTKHQIRDNYIYPLINHGYIDETDSELDKRARILYPLIVLDKYSKNERLHDKNKSLNLFQGTKISVENYDLYPSKQYIKSEIESLLKYVIQTPFCKEIKILDHEGQEIKSIDELVDRYYHSPHEYFHFNRYVDSEKAAVAAATNNILYGYQVLQNQLSKNNFDKSAFKISHLQNTKTAREYQQNSCNNIENTTENLEESNKLSEYEKTSQSLSFSCYHCDNFHTVMQYDYEKHVITKHHDKLCYPTKADIEKLGLKPQGKEWET